MRLGVSKKFVLILNISLPIMICIFLLTATMFFFYSKRSANIEGLSFNEFLSSCSRKIDLKKSYSGWYVFARESYNQAMMYFAFSVIFFILWISKFFQIRRDRRILKYLDEQIEEKKS